MASRAGQDRGCPDANPVRQTFALLGWRVNRTRDLEDLEKAPSGRLTGPATRDDDSTAVLKQAKQTDRQSDVVRRIPLSERDLYNSWTQKEKYGESRSL